MLLPVEGFDAVFGVFFGHGFRSFGCGKKELFGKGVAHVHEGQGRRGVAVEEVDFAGGVGGDFLEGFEGLNLDVGGVLGDGFVEFGDFVGLSVGKDTALLGLQFGGLAVGLGFGNNLLLFGTEAFEFGFLFFNFLLTFFLGLNGAGDERGEADIANEDIQTDNAAFLEVVAHRVEDRGLEVFLGFLKKEILGADDALTLFADNGAELGLNLDADGVIEGAGFLKDAGGFLTVDTELDADVHIGGELVLRWDAGAFLEFFLPNIVEGELVEGIDGDMEALAVGFIDDFTE